MSKRLAAKAGLIQLPDQSPVASVGVKTETVEPKAKTAPGAMMQFLSSQSDAIKEADLLKEQFKRFEGATPVLSIEAQRIRPSKWANRHASSFEGAEFESFKAEIASANGNVQPIRVRPLRTSALGGLLSEGPRYELIYGHRRHRACLELGIPVSAIVDEATDQQLFEAMERENRNRKNLSAWEQGCMYLRAIDEGLYGSQRKLAEAIGVDVSLISKSLALARLPSAVVEAFPSPVEIQFRWAQPLSEALQKDPEGLLKRAQKIRADGRKLSALQVLDQLTLPQKEKVAPSTAFTTQRRISARGKNIGQITLDERGRALVHLDGGTVSASNLDAFVRHLEMFLSDE
jgi:ParB family chromosome partitioning protein